MTDMTNQQREAFEAAYAAINPITSTLETAWLCWQAATAAERERCAKVCDRLSEGAWLAEQIRKG
jgi:hypothetical protein